MTRQQVLKMASKKMRQGAKKYGAWDPKTDKRDLKKEMTEELLDFLNYNIMQIQKLNK